MVSSHTDMAIQALRGIKKKKINLVKYVAITVLSKPLAKSCCHADSAEPFPQHLRSNAGNDIPYVLFLNVLGAAEKLDFPHTVLHSPGLLYLTLYVLPASVGRRVRTS